MVPFLLFLGLFLSAPQKPQEKPPQQQEQKGGFKIGVSVNQVFLSVNARSVNGGFVRGLTKDDFEVFEDGVRQKILNFYSEAVPVHVVLLIDASGSTQEEQGAMRRAAIRFAESLTPEDRIAIIAFSDRPVLKLDWTNDLDKVRNAVESVYAKGATVLNDAIYVTFDDLLKKVDGKKAVILLTDGADTGSMVTQKQAFDLAVRSQAMVYVVSKLQEYWAGAIQARGNSWPVPRVLSDDYIINNKRFLQRLAQQTGGKVLDSQSFATLADVYAQVAEELKNQYYLSYSPTNILRDGAWRTVEVRVEKPGVVVSTRPGYYAPLDHTATP